MGGAPLSHEINRRVFGIRKSISVQLYDSLPMLSTGMIDSYWSACFLLIGMQLWPHLPYVTDYPMVMWQFATPCLDKGVFDRIMAFADKWGPRYGFKDGQDLAQRWLEASDRELKEGGLFLRNGIKRAREGLLKKGVEEVHFPDGELNKLRQKAESFYYEMADKYYPRSLLDELLKYREEYRKLKAEGKLGDFHKTGNIPGGDQRDEWRTQWGK